MTACVISNRSRLGSARTRWRSRSTTAPVTFGAPGTIRKMTYTYRKKVQESDDEE
jgi:hypothetical protein